jgi:hypothetical protein
MVARMRAHLLPTLALAASLAFPPDAGAAPRGTVTGVLRYKGCSTGVPGATISVIGRDRTATTDSGGRFLLELPPGTYSLVIRGPRLVADQRVDDVVLAQGKLRDLGVVEVWADERPQACIPEASPPAPGPETTVAAAPDLPAVDLPGASVAPCAVPAEHVMLRGSPGTGPGQFGLQGNPLREDEDALGPPSFAVGAQGTLVVLDVLNGRIQRFDPKGKFLGAFPVTRPGADPVVESDLAVADEGGVFLYSEGDPPTLSLFDPQGRVLLSGALPPSFKGVDQLVAGRRPLFLMLNGQSVRAELVWGGIRAEGPLPGLPAGDVFVQAERASRWMAAVRFIAADGRVRRTVHLRSQVPITRVRLVGVNRRGDVVVAVDRSEGSADDSTRAEVLLVAVTPQGQVAGSIAVPPGERRWLFREFALAPDGSVVQMQSDLVEVRLVRWNLHAAGREALAGEGMVRGRILDGVRPAVGVPVVVPRAHRTASTAMDGSFELRLPAGTWMLTFRRPSPAGTPELPPAELRVAVAAGATVDVGVLQLAAQQRAGPAVPLPAPTHPETVP